MYQTSLKREEYLEGTIPDLRNVLVNYGHWLEKLGIENEGTLEDYENYLMERDKQLEQKRQDEHLELICWINSKQEWECDFMIIKGEEYERFMQSDYEDDEMHMIITNHNEFYPKFKDITGIDLLELTDNFVSMSYIDEAQNDIEIIINDVNGNNERFIIGI